MNKPPTVSGLLETVNTQNAVIKMQSEIIDELFSLLLQHVTADDDGLSSILENMETASKLQQNKGGEHHANRTL